MVQALPPSLSLSWCASLPFHRRNIRTASPPLSPAVTTACYHAPPFVRCVRCPMSDDADDTSIREAPKQGSLLSSAPEILLVSHHVPFERQLRHSKAATPPEALAAVPPQPLQGPRWDGRPFGRVITAASWSKRTRKREERGALGQPRGMTNRGVSFFTHSGRPEAKSGTYTHLRYP